MENRSDKKESMGENLPELEAIIDRLIEATVKKAVSECKTRLECIQLIRSKDYFKDCETKKIK